MLVVEALDDVGHRLMTRAVLGVMQLLIDRKGGQTAGASNCVWALNRNQAAKTAVQISGAPLPVTPASCSNAGVSGAIVYWPKLWRIGDFDTASAIEDFPSLVAAIGLRLSIAMPIRPQCRWLYPIDWRELSTVIRFERAKGRCEHCSRPHGRIVICLGDGRWWDGERAAWRDGKGRPLRRGAEAISFAEIRSTRVYLATAHLDHDPANNRPRNLKALCQRCHMLNDRDEHRRQRWLTLRMRKALGDLFLGPYKFG